MVITISNTSLGANGFSQRMKAPPGLIFSVSPEMDPSGVSIVMNQDSSLRVYLRLFSIDTPPQEEDYCSEDFSSLQSMLWFLRVFKRSLTATKLQKSQGK
jgi:hypothetical protein